MARNDGSEVLWGPKPPKPSGSEYFAVFLRETRSKSNLATEFGVAEGDLSIQHMFEGQALAGQVFWVKPKVGVTLKSTAFASSRYVVYQCRSDKVFQVPMRVAQPIETKEFLEASWLPPRPSLKPITGRQIDVVNHCCYQPYFGDFEWDDNPTPDERDGIKIRGTWAKENIIYVSIPQVKEIRGGMGGTIMFNIRAASQLKALWQAWEACGFVSKVNKVWGYAPRYQRNNHSFISNHAWGTAFDINEDQNKQGHEPARLGEYGCVREMVEVANRYGFYWGGHWDGASRDGMHFEVAKCM